MLVDFFSFFCEEVGSPTSVYNIGYIDDWKYLVSAMGDGFVGHIFAREGKKEAEEFVDYSYWITATIYRWL